MSSTEAAAKVLLGSKYRKKIHVESRFDPAISGEIEFALPTIQEVAQIGVLQHDMRQGRDIEKIDVMTMGLIITTSTLSVVVRSAPAWWYRDSGDGKKVAAPELLVAQDIIGFIWEEYVAFRDTFPGRDSNAGGGQAAGGANATSSGEAAASTPVL